MKIFSLKSGIQIIFTLLFLCFSFYEINAQCEPANITQKTYCTGQSAEILISDTDTKVQYAWYTSLIDDIGDYGLDGNGRQYQSPGTQNAPATFYYEKETTDNIGPAIQAATGGQEVLNDDVNFYAMPFEVTQTTEILSYNVVVKMTDPAKLYRFGTRLVDNNMAPADTTFSSWSTSMRSAHTALGGDLYLVNVPVTNIEIAAGADYLLEFLSADDIATSSSAVEEIYWFAGGQFPGNNFVGGSVIIADPTKTVSGTNLSPLLMDWEVVVKCPRTAVTTELSTACCTPVGDNFSVTTPNFNPTAYPITLTASGADVNASMYYYWYDVSGVLINDGQGLDAISVGTQGTYTVRVVNDPGDEVFTACFGNRTALIGIRNIFAPDDTTICIGTPITFTGTGAEGAYRWYSNDPLADAAITTPNSQSTDFVITTPGTYTLTVEGEVKLGNIANDGKFENFDDAINFDPALTGNTFETTYGISGGGTPPGSFISGNSQFRVDNELKAWSENSKFCENNPNFWSKTDPGTGTTVSRGNIFYADAHTLKPEMAQTDLFGANNYLWQLSNQPVEPNQTYEFSMDVTEWNTSTAPIMMLLVNGVSLDLFVDGVNVGKTYSPPSGATNGCVWKTVTASWPSGANTSATITVSEVSNQLTGYEFAMDDITFSTGRGLQSDNIVVTVTDACLVVEARDDTASCIGAALPVYLKQNSGFLIDWKDQNGTVVSTEETADIYPTGNNEYTATVKFPVLNFIKNGDFDERRLDFITDLTDVGNNSALNQGQHVVSSGGSSVVNMTQNSLNNQVDHTSGTTAGNLMFLRFSQDQTILRKDIDVITGEDYGFSIWMKHMHDGTNNNDRDYTIDVVIDAVTVETFTVPAGSDWTKYSYNWSSAVTNTITFELIPRTSHFETPLAIDDVTLAQLGVERTDKFIASISNCFVIEAMVDQTVCIGDPLTLSTVRNDGVLIDWKDSGGQVISTTVDPQVYPIANETYTATAKFPFTQLLLNGDFETGSTAPFTTSFNTTTNNSLNNGDYLIGFGNESKLNTAQFSVTQTDHTTGTGQMMLMRVGNATRSVLTTPFTVQNGEDYYFSSWVKNMHPHVYSGTFVNSADHEIEIFLDGVSVLNYTLTQNVNWNQVEYSWQSTLTGTSTIEMRVTSTKSESTMALDDVQISQLGFEDSDDVVITANICNTFTLQDLGCDGANYKVKINTDAEIDGWYEADGTTLVTTDSTLSVQVATPTDYIARISLQIGNAITNGDFSAGDDGSFTSETGQHNPTQSSMNANNYFITSDATFLQQTAALNNAGNDFLVVQSAKQDNEVAYTYPNLSLTGGTEYVFSFDFAYLIENDIATNVGPVEVRFGGVTVATLNPSAVTTWQTQTVSYTPPVDVTGDIQIVNMAAGSSAQKYTVGLDNISLASLLPIGDMTFEVQPCAPAAVDLDTTFCQEVSDASIDLSTFELIMTDNGASTASGWFSSEANANANTSPIVTTTGLSPANGDQFFLRTEDGGGNSVATLTFTINASPTVTAGSDEVDGELCLGEDVVFNGGGATSYVWDNGVTNNVAFTPVATGNVTYTVTGTDGNSCTNTATIDINVNALPVVTAGSDEADGELCLGEDIVFNGGGATSYVWDNGVTNNVAFTPASSGNVTYTVTGTDGNTCTNTATIDINVNALPTADLDGGGPICDDGSDTENFTITLTGEGPWTVLLDVPNSPTDSSLTFNSSPGSVAVMADGTYTLAGVSDDNCPTGTLTGTPPVVTYHADVAATSATRCDDESPLGGVTLANNEFQIVVTASAGDLNSVAVSELTTHGVSFTETTVGSGIWYSGAIAEVNNVDLNVTDANDCNGGVDIASINTRCSCPASGLTAITLDSICAEGNTTITVTSSGGAGNYDVTLTQPDATTQTDLGITGPTSTFTVDQEGNYSVTVRSITDACTVNGGTVSLGHYEAPVAQFTGATEICNDGSTTDLTITLTSGKGPFAVDLTGDGTFGTSNLTNLTSPHTEAVSNAEVYTLSNLVDDNSCIGTVSGTPVIGYHTDVTAVSSTECDDGTPLGGVALGDAEFQIVINVSQGDTSSIAISESTAHGVSFTETTAGSGIWYSGAIAEANSIDLNVTDANDCNGGMDIASINTRCSCPASGSTAITLDSICAEGNTMITVTSSGGAGNYDVTLTQPDATTQTDLGIAGPASTFTVDQEGNYSVTVRSITDACTVNGGTVSLGHYDVPNAVLTGDTSICNGVSTDLMITLTAGKGPFDIDLTGDGTFGTSNLTNLTSPHTEAVSNAEVYNLSNLLDANSCIGTVSGTATVDYHENVIAASATRCDDESPLGSVTLSNDEFQIVVIMASGDLNTVSISEFTAHGVSFNETSSGSGIWFSDAISELNTVDLNVTDVNDCNGGFDISSINTRCSCPESVALSVTGATEICEEGTLTSSELTVVLDDGGNTVPDWAFAVIGPDGNPVIGQDYRTVRYSGPTTFTIPVSDSGSYSIVDLNGTCIGSVPVAVDVNYFDSPKGQLSGSIMVCSDASDTVDVTIEVQDLGFPATAVLSRATGGDTTITLNTATSTFRTSVANTYSLSSITDNNTCTAKATDLSGTVVIDTITPPIANIFSVDGDEDLNPNMFSIKEKLTTADTLEVIATAITDAYLGTWKIDGYQGDTIDTKIDTVSVFELDSIAEFPDTLFNDKGVTRLVYCVVDTAGICDVVTDTLKIVKVTGSIVINSDTTLCEDYDAFTREGTAPLPFETSQWQYGDNQIMPAGTVVPGGRIITIPAGLAPGTYLFNYIIVNTVDPMAPPTVSVFTVNVDQLPTAPTVKPLPPISVCVEDANLNAETPLVGGGIWEKISGTGDLVSGEESLPSATVENLVETQSGVYRWRLSNGVCVNKDSVDVTVSRVGSLSPASISVDGVTIPDGDTLPFCINETPTIFNGGFDALTENGVWEIIQGSPTIINESTVASSQNMTLASGISEVKWLVSKIDDSCPSDSVTIVVAVSDLPVANIVNVTPTELCEGESVTVTVDPVGTQTTSTAWSVAGTPLTATAGASTEEFILQAGLTDVAGTKTITWTASNAVCGDVSGTTNITVNEVFDPQFDINPESTKCENGTVTYTLINTQDLAGAFYEWSYAGVGTQGATNGATFTISDLGITTGSTVSLTVGSGFSCNAGDSAQTKKVDLEVIGGPAPTLDMSSLDTSICETETLTIFATDLQGGTLQWFYEGIAIPGETGPSLTNRNLPGVYHLEETSTVCGARRTLDLTLTLDELPDVFAGNDRVIMEEEIANLEGSISIGDTTWSTSSTVISNSNIIVDHQDAQSPLNTTNTGGIYTLYLIATNGECTNFDDVEINIRKKIKAPNVFTPNGDGTHDLFEVAGLETYPVAKMYIYNRWGNPVFESKTDHYNDELWEGNVPEGVYYYTIEIGEGKGTGHSGVIHVFRD